MGKDRFIPHLLGHEGSGEVLQTSSDVKHVKPGDKVVMHWMKNSFINQSNTPNFFNKENSLLSLASICDIPFIIPSN